MSGQGRAIALKVPKGMEPPPHPAAQRYERQAAQSAERLQLFMLQAELFYRLAGEERERGRHYLALADLARAKTLGPSVSLAAVFRRAGGQETPAAERQAAG